MCQRLTRRENANAGPARGTEPAFVFANRASLAGLVSLLCRKDLLQFRKLLLSVRA